MFLVAWCSIIQFLREKPLLQSLHLSGFPFFPECAWGVILFSVLYIGIKPLILILLSNYLTQLELNYSFIYILNIYSVVYVFFDAQIKCISVLIIDEDMMFGVQRTDTQGSFGWKIDRVMYIVGHLGHHRSLDGLWPL